MRARSKPAVSSEVASSPVRIEEPTVNDGSTDKRMIPAVSMSKSRLYPSAVAVRSILIADFLVPCGSLMASSFSRAIAWRMPALPAIAVASASLSSAYVSSSLDFAALTCTSFSRTEPSSACVAMFAVITASAMHGTSESSRNHVSSRPAIDRCIAIRVSTTAGVAGSFMVKVSRAEHVLVVRPGLGPPLVQSTVRPSCG